MQSLDNVAEKLPTVFLTLRSCCQNLIKSFHFSRPSLRAILCNGKIITRAMNNSIRFSLLFFQSLPAVLFRAEVTTTRAARRLPVKNRRSVIAVNYLKKVRKQVTHLP